MGQQRNGSQRSFLPPWTPTGLVLTSGDDGRVISICPPLCIDRDLLELAIDLLIEAIA